MIPDSRKVVIVGTGLVGTSYAYALLNQNACDELVLIDINEKQARGEAMDLNHGVPFSGGHMRIRAGTYDDCADADLVVICAGVPQKEGETRLDLLRNNYQVFRSIVFPVVQSGFAGIFLVATNPVDVMTRITCALSGFPPHRVIGTGTTLDTARLRYLLGAHFGVDPRNMHAYVMGEHGDSEFVPWSQAMFATIPIKRLMANNTDCSDDCLRAISKDVREAAYRIIEAKRATYYGVGMAMVRITRAIFNNEHCVLTVSAMLSGEYGENDVYAGVPCVIGREGVQSILTLALTDEELHKFHRSCEILRDAFAQLPKVVHT